MTPLTQQLEDKKKELKELHEEKTGIEDCYESNTRLNEDWDYSQILKRMEILKKEIAILEQAIAEIKKQRKEILNKIDKIFIEHYTDNLEEVPYQSSEYNRAEEVYEELKQQLNQPKTEQ